MTEAQRERILNLLAGGMSRKAVADHEGVPVRDVAEVERMDRLEEQQ